MLLNIGGSLIKRQTLRIPKNTRKFYLWDSAALGSTMQSTAQIVHNIEKQSSEQDIPIHLLGNTTLPMFLLHEICEHYTIMYNRLLKEQLLITANPPSNNNLH